MQPGPDRPAQRDAGKPDFLPEFTASRLVQVLPGFHAATGRRPMRAVVRPAVPQQ